MCREIGTMFEGATSVCMCYIHLSAADCSGMSFQYNPGQRDSSGKEEEELPGNLCCKKKPNKH